MSRTDKMGLFASVAAVALMFGSSPVSADGHLIGAHDNLAPAAPENFRADIDEVSTPRTVTLTWDLSVDDETTATSTGNYADASGATVSGNNVTGYIITRTATGEETVTVTVAAGVWELVDDDDLTAGVDYTYTLAVTDGTNTAENDEPLSVSVGAGAPPQAQLSVVDGEDIDFLTFAADEEAGEQIVVDNLATEVEAFLDVTIAVTGLGFASSDASLLVGPEDVAEFTISFSATAAGNIDGIYTGTLTIGTNDPDAPETVVTLRATIDGGDEAAVLDVVGDGLTWVNVPVNESRTQELTIQNLGEVDATADLVLSGDDFDVFGIELTTVNVSAGGTASVDVTFTPDEERDDFSALITITSAQAPAADPITFVLAGAAGVVAPDNPVQVAVVAVTTTFSATCTDTEDLTFRESLAAAFALTAGIDVSLVVVSEVICGSTIVTFQILEPPADDPDAPSAAEVAAAVEDLVATEPATFEAAFTDEGLALGTVDAIASEAVTVVVQPIDPSGASVVAWFTRTGTRVDFDDFALFAEAFGANLGDDAYDDIFDISGPEFGVADGRIDFDDFSRFASDFGKTVANAADIQALLGG